MKKLVLLLLVAGAPIACDLNLSDDSRSSTESRAEPIRLTFTFENRDKSGGISILDGQGRVSIARDHQMVCYKAELGGVKAVHVHDSRRLGNPAVVVLLEPPDPYQHEACTGIDPDVAESIIENPSGFYLDFHHSQTSKPLQAPLESGKT